MAKLLRVDGNRTKPAIRCRRCGGWNSLVVDGDEFVHRAPYLCSKDIWYDPQRQKELARMTKLDTEFEAEAVLCMTTNLIQAIPDHDPSQGRIGDCFRTAIACLIGADSPEDVPHFGEARWNDPEALWEDVRLARHWLRETHELDLMSVTLLAAQRMGVPFIAAVLSQKGPWNHAVIGRYTEVIWDPSGLGGYNLNSVKPEDSVEILVTPYEPGPDELIRRWREDPT